MTDFLHGLNRTCMCGEVNKAHIGKQIVLMGWANRRRDLGGLIFVQLRDRSGIVQTVFDSTNTDKDLFEKATTIKHEYVLAVTGTVRLRTQENINLNMPTGEVEVVAEDLLVLSKSEVPPFSVGDSTANEPLRAKYRYLDLRRADLQKNLIVRSKIAQVARNFLSDNGFIEIETPMLGKSTPEGARDYLVPSRVHAGEYYALPQSPQLYKQLLMISGFDRYFQITKCFRDEDLRANRQPEFTQIDIEMSFVDKPMQVMEIIEKLVKKVFLSVGNIKLQSKLPQMTFDKAMQLYGSDKPDTRFDMTITNLTQIAKTSGFAPFQTAISAGGSVRAIVLKGCDSTLTRKDFDFAAEFVRSYKAKGVYWHTIGEVATRTSFAKAVNAEAMEKMLKKAGCGVGDSMFVIAEPNDETVLISLGALRCELAKKHNLIDKNIYKALWVTEFPLLEYSAEDERFVARHHPFTSPMEEDLHLFKTAPEKIRAKAYDLVINGEETCGGSIRIYNNEIQQLMFNTIGFSNEDIQERFGFFMDAFKYGVPPHGGVAFGLDRLAMHLNKTENIKDVIAFPKMQNARCLMMDAPNKVEEKQLKELCLKFHKYE